MARPELALPADLTVGSDDQSSGVDVDSALDDLLGDFEMLRGPNDSTQDDEEDTDADNADGDDDLLKDESGDEEDKAEGDDTADQDDLEDDDSDDDSTDDKDEEEGEDEEIDWTFKVPVKVDGEDSEVDLGELVKGYQTSQHLSKKGRDLANERKAFEEERTTEMSKLKETAQVLEAQNKAKETTLSKEYSDLQNEIKAAKKDGDRYKVDNLTEKLEEIQTEYWTARKTREKIEEALKSNAEQESQKSMEAAITKFNEEIGDYVPDFDETKATKIREFALSKGIPEEVLATLVDARIIGAINEFMTIAEKVSKGSAKRKAAPKRTPSTTKKTKPTSVKQNEQRKAVSKRISSGEADTNDLDNALDALVGRYF